MQYVPNDGVYVYFRHDNSKTIMVATNTMEKEMNLETSGFYERIKGFTNARNVMTGETISSLSLLKLPAKTAIVLELIK